MKITRASLAEAARSRVGGAIKKGELKPPQDFACTDCGGEATQYDHRDYRLPLVVEAVCDPCNRKRPPALPESSVNSSEAHWYSPTGRKKSMKFQMRMHGDDHRLLMSMADLDRLSMSEWIHNQIRAEAKRRGLK